MALGKSRWKVRVSLTSLGEVEHRGAWKYRRADNGAWEGFTSIRVSGGEGIPRPLYVVRLGKEWVLRSALSHLIGRDVPLGELQLRLLLLLLKHPEEVLAWARGR